MLLQQPKGHVTERCQEKVLNVAPIAMRMGFLNALLDLGSSPQIAAQASMI